MYKQGEERRGGINPLLPSLKEEGNTFWRSEPSIFQTRGEGLKLLTEVKVFGGTSGGQTI